MLVAIRVLEVIRCFVQGVSYRYTRNEVASKVIGS